MQQRIRFGRDARTSLKEGINLAADVVCSTFGPKGLNVISNYIEGGIRSTKDGVSALNEIVSDDPFVNAGVKLVRQAAQKTADDAGDSTTTTTMLTRELVNSVEELLERGESPVVIRKQLEKECEQAVQWLKDKSVPVGEDVEKIRHIATTSANNDERIGNLIAEAYGKIGSYGVITLEENTKEVSEVEVLGGYHLDKGMVTPLFITDEKKRECILERPLILMYDKRISKLADLLPVLKYIMNFPVEGKTVRRSLLIIANSSEGEALGTLVQNKMKGILEVCVVFSPNVGIRRTEILQDIAVFTGGKVVSEDYGMGLDQANFDPGVLGEAQRVVVTKDRCVIVNGQGGPKDIEDRREMIKTLLEEKEEDEYLRGRLGSIGKGVAILKIGANTDIERNHLRDLAEDAILAVRAAVEEGYLPGGGSALYHCKVDGILGKALKKPMEVLRENAGYDTNEAGRYGYGINVLTEKYCDLVESGVIDATKVVRCAVENAVGITIMYLTTQVLISQVPDNYPNTFLVDINAVKAKRNPIMELHSIPSNATDR